MLVIPFKLSAAIMSCDLSVLAPVMPLTVVYNPYIVTEFLGIEHSDEAYDLAANH